MSVAEARNGAHTEGDAPSIGPEGVALEGSLRAVVEGRGAGLSLSLTSVDELPEATWESGASIRLYCGIDEVQDFAVFGDTRAAGSLVRWLFDYGDDELVTGARLEDGLGETLNQVVGRIKNELEPVEGFAPKLDTPEILARTASEMYGRVHSDATLFVATSEAWSGQVVFQCSPRRQQAIAALQEATSLLMRFGLDRDAMVRSCRLLEEVRAPVLALAELPAMGITLSWCTENLAVLVNGLSGYREKALFHRVVSELDSLRTALVRLTSPKETTAYLVPTEDDLRALLTDFCGEARRSIKEATEALSSKADDLAHRLFRTMHTIRGNAAFFGLDQVQRVAHGTQNLLGSVRDSGARLSEQQVDAVRHSTYLLEDWVDALEAALRGDGVVQWSPDMEAHCRMLEHFLECGGRLAVPRPGRSDGGPGGDLSAMLRLDESQLCRLEAIRTEVKRWADVAAKEGQERTLAEQVEFLERAHSQLAAICQSVRRVELSGLLGNLARHCREASQRHGKLVRVDVSGDGLSAPEHLVAAMSGPLVHLVNNAIEHGIEDASDRQAAGKKVLALVELRAAQVDGNLVLEVSDDGRGLPQAAIVERARAMGISEDSSAIDLAFLPGLSTTDGEVDPSDRGVGLDVVKREVARSEGTVELTSSPGQGTRIRITVPELREMMDELISAPEEEAVVEPLDADGELNFL